MAANAKDNQASGSGFGAEDNQSAPSKAVEGKKPANTAQKKAAPNVPPKKRRNPMAKAKNAETQIPEAVSNRMIRRVAIASGIPSALAFAVLPMSYYATEQGWVEIPSFVILVASIGCLVIGLLGISYGVLSASWDDSREGDWLGIDEFKLNLGRMRDAQRSRRDSKSPR